MFRDAAGEERRLILNARIPPELPQQLDLAGMVDIVLDQVGQQPSQRLAMAFPFSRLCQRGVRERLATVIEQRLITKSHEADVPADLGMFSPEGNQLVRASLVSYLAETAPRADALNLDEASRRAAVWDGEAASSEGTPVDEFLGWVD